MNNMIPRLRRASVRVPAILISLASLALPTLSLAEPTHGEPYTHGLFVSERGDAAIEVQAREELGYSEGSLRFRSVALDSDGRIVPGSESELGNGWYSVPELSSRLWLAYRALEEGREKHRPNKAELVLEAGAGIGFIGALTIIVPNSAPAFMLSLAAIPHIGWSIARRAIWGSKLVPMDEELARELAYMFRQTFRSGDRDGRQELTWDEQASLQVRRADGIKPRQDAFRLTVDADYFEEMIRLLGTRALTAPLTEQNRVEAPRFEDMIEGLSEKEIARREELALKVRAKQRGASAHPEHRYRGLRR